MNHRTLTMTNLLNLTHTTLPKLLPNSVAQPGTKADGERFATAETETKRNAAGRNQTGRDDGDRISRPVP
jgi:hypothetical protein